MSVPLQPQPHQRHVTFAPTKAGKSIQIVQGAYYILGGLLAGFLIQSIQGPTDDPRYGTNLWVVRSISFVVAGFGVALFTSGARAGKGFMPAGAAMWVAIALLAQTAAGMAFGLLPLTFLIDAAAEALFASWWIVLGALRLHDKVETTFPLTS